MAADRLNHGGRPVDLLDDQPGEDQPGGDQKIVLATGNRGKLQEIQALLGNSRELISQSDLGILPADETGSTYVENALIKARSASGAANLPAIADDSGLEVDALGGAPGVRSARYAQGSGGERRRCE